MAFQEIPTGSGNQYKFANPGDALTGHYLGDDTITIKGKETIRHSFKVDGEVTTTLGSYSLNEILEKVTPGQLVRLTYTGKKTTGKGNTVKVFKAEVDATDTIPVGGVATKAPKPTTADAIAAMRSE